MCREYGQSDSPFIEFTLSALAFHCTSVENQSENLCKQRMLQTCLIMSIGYAKPSDWLWKWSGNE